MNEISMTVGKIKPLGIERLKLCEAFTEFIRLNSHEINDKLAELKLSITILVEIYLILQDLFFEYPWNNFLHSVVTDMIVVLFSGDLTESVSLINSVMPF